MHHPRGTIISTIQLCKTWIKDQRESMFQNRKELLRG
jgi:hypothetical protein